MLLVCQVVAWPSPSTETLMEENLPPERYESEGHPKTPFIVFVIRFAKLFVAVAYALRCQMHIKSLTETCSEETFTVWLLKTILPAISTTSIDVIEVNGLLVLNVTKSAEGLG